MIACLREKKSKCSIFFQVGVCALHTLGRHVVKHGLKLKLRGLKLRLQRKFKIRDFYLLGSYPLVGRRVEKHDYDLILKFCVAEKKSKFEKKNVWVVGYPVSWAPCCE